MPRSAANPIAVSTSVISPRAPLLTSSRTRSGNGPNRYLKASTSGSPAASAAARISSVSATEIPSGFSHSTALPAASAAMASSRCEVCTVPM